MRPSFKTFLVVLPLGGIVWSIATAFAASPVRVTASVLPSPWCGGVTTSQAIVKARLARSGVTTRLVFSDREDLTAARFSFPSVSAASTGNIVAMPVTELQPATTYYYALELDGILDRSPGRTGRFTTCPAGPASFKFVMGGDRDDRKYSQKIFETIRGERPLFVLFLGDLHYRETNTLGVEPYRVNYDAVLSVPAFGLLMRSAPIVYIWDDHDCTGNNTDRTRIGIRAARLAYREYVPSHPLATASGTINHAFSVGRARFIVTDNRTARDPSKKADTAQKSMLGSEQKAWFKRELLAAVAAEAKIIFWVSTSPWIGAPLPNKDRWQSYTTERTEIADFLKTHAIRNVCILSADMHALAYDDGTNSDYATGGGMPIPVLHAAPLAKSGSRKGGPYSSGKPIQGTGQYGVVEVTDNGGPTVSVEFTGKRGGPPQQTLLRYRFSRP